MVSRLENKLQMAESGNTNGFTASVLLCLLLTDALLYCYGSLFDSTNCLWCALTRSPLLLYFCLQLKFTCFLLRKIWIHSLITLLILLYSSLDLELAYKSDLLYHYHISSNERLKHAGYSMFSYIHFLFQIVDNFISVVSYSKSHIKK